MIVIFTFCSDIHHKCTLYVLVCAQDVNKIYFSKKQICEKCIVPPSYMYSTYVGNIGSMYNICAPVCTYI